MVALGVLHWDEVDVVLLQIHYTRLTQHTRVNRPLQVLPQQQFQRISAARNPAVARLEGGEGRDVVRRELLVVELVLHYLVEV